MSDFKPTFQSPACPTPSGAATGGVAESGGLDLGPGTKYETENMSGLAKLPATYNPGPGTPGSQVTMPPVASPGTIPSEGAGN